MPHTSLYYRPDPRILGWLAERLREEIPDLDPYGRDRRLLEFAFQDLETCLGASWRAAYTHELRAKLKRAGDSRPQELKAFLKVWVDRWLTKWRMRVSLFQKPPKTCSRHRRTVNRAKKEYREMEKGRELKRLAIRRLVDRGEVCMPGIIADTLIVEEIARQIDAHRGDPSATLRPNAAETLQGVLHRIKALADRKQPFIYLKIKPERKPPHRKPFPKKWD